MINAELTRQQRKIRRACFELKAAVTILSEVDTDDPAQHEVLSNALDWSWEALDAALGTLPRQVADEIAPAEWWDKLG